MMWVDVKATRDSAQIKRMSVVFYWQPMKLSQMKLTSAKTKKSSIQTLARKCWAHADVSVWKELKERAALVKLTGNERERISFCCFKANH